MQRLPIVSYLATALLALAQLTRLLGSHPASAHAVHALSRLPPFISPQRHELQLSLPISLLLFLARATRMLRPPRLLPRALLAVRLAWHEDLLLRRQRGGSRCHCHSLLHGALDLA